MTDTFDRLKTALAGRYAIERRIGAGGNVAVSENTQRILDPV